MGDTERERYLGGISTRRLVSLGPDLKRQLDALSALEDVPTGLLLDRAVRRYLDERGRRTQLLESISTSAPDTRARSCYICGMCLDADGRCPTSPRRA